MSQEHEYLIAPNGRLFDLADYALFTSGIGEIPTEYQSTRGYRQHGVTVRDYHLTPRTIAFTFDMSQRRRTWLWEARARLIDTLRPNNGSGVVTYRHVLPSGARRDIRGRIQELSQTEIDGRNLETNFTLFCEDPTFFDPKLKVGLFLADEADAFTLPFSIPDGLWFGMDAMVTATVNNPGSFYAYPKLIITGPYTRLAVANQTLGVSFVLGGGGAAVDDVIVVDLTPGHESITHNNVFALDELEDGNLVDWYIRDGDNDLQASGVGLTGATSVRVEFYPRYIAL